MWSHSMNRYDFLNKDRDYNNIHVAIIVVGLLFLEVWWKSCRFTFGCHIETGVWFPHAVVGG